MVHNVWGPIVMVVALSSRNGDFPRCSPSIRRPSGPQPAAISGKQLGCVPVSGASAKQKNPWYMQSPLELLWKRAIEVIEVVSFPSQHGI